jgi:hypothetical protein
MEKIHYPKLQQWLDEGLTPQQWLAYSHLLDPNRTRSFAMPFPPQRLFTDAA